MTKKIMIGGIKCVPEQPRAGKRVVLVVDRGWIFAGDIVRDDERIVLERAVWVFRWEQIGFAAVVADPTQGGIDIRPLSTTVDVPRASEVFRLPVADDWGVA